MNVFRIHIKGEDQYLNREGREVSAVDAPLFAKDEVREAEGIAHKKFGHRWRIYAAVEPMPEKDFMAHIGRKGGQTVTRTKREHLYRLHANRFHYRKWRMKYDRSEYIFVARSLAQVKILLTTNQVSLSKATIWRHLKEIRGIPEPLQGLELNQPIGFVRCGKKEWRRI
jgi:hypothetical protein